MKTIVIILVATFSAAAGEAFLALGMKEIGDISIQGPARMVAMVSNWKVLLGVLFMLGFFLTFSAALSWADLSYVQPLTAMTFVFGVLIARYVLGEAVSGWRWAGVAAIVVGVVLISQDANQLTTGK